MAGRCLGLAASLALCGLASASSAAAQDVLGNSTLFDTLIVQRIQHEFLPDLSPAVLAFDAKTKQATLTITNHADSARQFDLTLEFYRVRTDTAGVITATGSAPAPNDAPTITDWIKGLPAHVTIPAHGSQTVTLTADVPSSASADEYWGRVVVTAPSVVREVSAVIQQVSASPTGGAPVLQQQPANVKVTFGLTSNAKLVYRRNAPAATFTLNQLTATVLPSGQLRTCVAMHRTGSAAVMGTVHVALRTPAGRDTLAQSFPIEVQDDIQPCFNANLLGAVAGTYTLSFDVTPGQDKVPASAVPSFAAAHMTTTFELKTPIGHAPGARAETDPIVAGGVPYIELATDQGTLQEQLKREAATAAKDGKRVLVEIGASWCGPCQAFLQSLKDSVMISSLQEARVVRVDFNRWGQAFVNGPFATPPALPNFFLVNADGTAGPVFDTNEWQVLANEYGGLSARVMGPPLKTFIEKNNTATK